ncbi:MAG: zinc-binding dehydrogenase [Leptospira sp.]|nr:zinc-binding dehydrogenase [Leptospira sp.]
MKVLREIAEIEKKGRLDRLYKRSDELSEPGKGEVQVKIRAIGLNFADIFAIYGLYSATPKGKFTPGLEFSGEVIAIGEDVTGFQVGQRIMGATRFGAYATHINQGQEYLFPIPDEWSYEEGAAFPVQALTAYYALFPLGNCNQDSVVLIHSAAGGVGLLANQFAKRVGATTIGSVGSESKVSILKENQFDEYIVRDKHFKEKMIQILKERKLNLVLECVGGKIFNDSYNLMSPMGRLVTYGSANFTPSGNSLNVLKTIYTYLNRPKIDPLKMVSDNKSVMGFNLIWLWDQVSILKAMMIDIMQHKPSPQHIGMVVGWDDLIKALKEFRSGKTTGKVVVSL